MSEINLREKVISLYFKVDGLDQIIKELLNEGIEINHTSICNIMRSYTRNLRSIKSFHDVDSEKMPDKQKDFIKTIINNEKAKRQYNEYLKKATAIKQEHIQNMREITKPFSESVRESDTMSFGLIQSELLDIFVNGATPKSLGEFIQDLEEVAVEKHIRVKTTFDNVIRHSEKDFEAIKNKVYERRAKKWLKDRRD